MEIEEYKYAVMVGLSRRKVEPLALTLGKPYSRGESNDWIVECSLSGYFFEVKVIEARSHFDCLMCGAAYLRQTLRLIIGLNPKLKLYFEFDGKLDEITIDDIFMTHDCVTNEIEDMVDWALENGYKADS